MDIIGRVVLPAFSFLMPGNPGVSYEIWDALKALPYEDRYSPPTTPEATREPASHPLF
jgi:hypothetical protein